MFGIPRIVVPITRPADIRKRGFEYSSLRTTIGERREGSRQVTPSRIVFVNRFFDPDRSATSQILSDLAFHLARRGMRVSVIASRGLYDDPEAALPAFETRKGVAIHRVYKPRFGRESLLGRAIDYIAMYGCFAAAAWRLTKRGDCLIAKTDPPLLSVALAPIAGPRHVSSINWLQDLYPEVALSLGMRALRPISPLLTAARNASLHMAARNVVIGSRMRDRLEAFGVAPERIDVIPNWCDDDAIKPIEGEGKALRSAWGLDDKFVVGYSGNLGRAHEYATLLDAANELRGEDVVVFLFIGGGHLMRPLKAEMERRGLTGMFRFQPYQDANILPQSLAVPDVHWLSLRPEMEGLIFPSKFYGIAAAGRPIITVSDPAGEVAQLVEQHDCGVAVACGDAAGLAAQIRRLRGDPRRLGRMGRNARNLLEQSFRKEFALRRWEQVICSLDANSRDSRCA